MCAMYLHYFLVNKQGHVELQWATLWTLWRYGEYVSKQYNIHNLFLLFLLDILNLSRFEYKHRSSSQVYISV